MIIQSLNLYFIQIGSGLGLLMALIQLLRKEGEKGLHPLFFLGLLVASLQSRLGLYLSQSPLQYPCAYFAVIFTLYCIGPFLLLLFIQMLSFAISPPKYSYRLHFFPAFIVLIYEIFFFALPLEIQRQQLTASFSSFIPSIINIGIFIGVGHISIYLLYIMSLFLKIKKNFDISYGGALYFIVISPVPTLIVAFLGYALQSKVLMHIGAAFITLICMTIFLIRDMYPGFFISLQKEIEEKRYLKTQLNGINLDAIKDRLLELMETDKIFMDEDIRLSTLADELKISPNQVSRIINEQFGQNFNEFINSFRIKEAQKLLLEDREKTILSIAFEVGFNTKATFNTQFVKFVKMTPSEFRKQNLR